MFICLSRLTSPTMNGLAKVLEVYYASLQVSWAMAFGHDLFAMTSVGASVVIASGLYVGRAQTRR